MGDDTRHPSTPAESCQPEAAPGLTATEHPSSRAASQEPQYGRSTAAPQHFFMDEMTYPHRTASFDMSSMAQSLPQTHYRTQTYGHGGPRYAGQAPMLDLSQYGASGGMGAIPAQSYYGPQHNPMASLYQPPMTNQPSSTMAPRPDLGYYTSPLVMNSQAAHVGPHFYYQLAAHFPGQPSHPVQFQGQPPLDQYRAPLNSHHQYPNSGSRQVQHGGPQELGATPPSPPVNGTEVRRSIVRGPPRKPRQRGHAIWIGNLPPQADLMSLVHHVCKETEGLESLFLISKSNCAFANYQDEQSCLAAQRKLHESRFMGVRLVSRLRKSTVEGPAGVTAPTGPAASAPQAGGLQEASTSGGGDGDESREKRGAPSPTPTAASFSAPPGSTPSVNGVPPAYKDRFFVLKSLTVEDLELSVRTRTWATQSHNEDKLNTAFKTSDNVYLVFSANKSGEYFGYARMVSAINEDPAAAIQFAPSAHAVSEVDLPKTIPTEATEFAPKGRIIDDSARGPIFWEVDRDHDDDDNNNDAETDENNGSGGQDGGEGETTGDAGSVRSGHDSGGSSASEPKAWGKPFEVEWLSTARLPFYRTRGLRNPWNSNREVKIARDGTELEPSVGRRLIGLFNRAQSPPVPTMPPPLPPSMIHGMAPPFGVRMQGPVPVGYPPLR